MEADVLVIGSGIAGLNFALKIAAHANVLLITKGKIKESNTAKAQGGIAAVLGSKDSKESHYKDTIKAGAGLSDPKAVRVLVDNAPKEIQTLEKWGVKFDKDNCGSLELTREGGHSHNRIVHWKDTTGNMIEETLIKLVKANKKIKVIDHCYALDLIVRDNVCYGCVAFKNKRSFSIFAKATVLASGGSGQIYKVTCNDPIATGEGYALAYRAGAVLGDMEFVQFHPTGLYGSKPLSLISEALRGEGAVLRNREGKLFMHKYHPMKELGPRDVVARAIVKEMKKYVYLDITHKDFVKKRFPSIDRNCLKQGIDFTKDYIPVTPCAHYVCGGVKVDTYAKSSVKQLFALGEVSFTGINGANRLASNSLMEAMVFATRAVSKIKQLLKKKLDVIEFELPKRVILGGQEKLRRKLKETMWENVGIIRSNKSLKKALSDIDTISKKAKSVELQNMLLTSKIIASAALKRKKNKGAHYNKDLAKA